MFHNRLLPILYKILDNGRIPIGHQVDEVLEEVRTMYYKEVKMEGAKADSADSDEEHRGSRECQLSEDARIGSQKIGARHLQITGGRQDKPQENSGRESGV
jgi:hypothetical protein